MVALPSINIPAIRTRIFTQIKKTYLFEHTDTINSVSCCGICSFVRIQEKTEAAAQNIPQLDFNNIKMPYGGNTAFNDEDFLKLQQMYNQAANSSGLNSTNPFTPSMPYQMNPNNSSTF